MTVKRRKVLTTLMGGISATVAGCSQLSSPQTLQIGFVRVVNLDDTSVDVRLELSPTGDGTVRQQTGTLRNLNTNGNGQADVLLYQPSDIHAISSYEYKLYINNKLTKRVDGQQIRKYYQEKYTESSCVVLHFYINEWETDVSFSSELCEDCNLPTK